MDKFEPPKFRKRNTHFPKTYFLLLKNETLYLLFWLEYGKDNSLYVWFDDDPSLGWEVIATHTQKDIIGRQEISLDKKPFDVFDPHISWHKSGRIHVSGYDKEGKRGEHLISDKKADSFEDLKKGITIPITQIVFPVANPNIVLKSFGKGPKELYEEQTFVGILNKDGFNPINDKAPAEAFFIIDAEIIPEKSHFAIDIGVHNKNFLATFVGPEKYKKELLFDKIISLHKEKTQIAAAIRVFNVNNAKKEAQESENIVATCFNGESVDLFALNRKK